MIYGGDGLARLPADERGRGKAAFVPFVLDGEEIEASLTEQKAGFARARAQSVVAPSPHRIEPGCAYFGRCGGCHYQHTSYEHQLEIKQEILRETLKRIERSGHDVFTARARVPKPTQALIALKQWLWT